VGIEANGSPEAPQVPPLELLELLLLELLLPPVVPPELELLLVLGWQAPMSLDSAIQVLPVAQPLSVVGLHNWTQFPVVTVVEVESVLQSHPAEQRSAGAQVTSSEQVAVSLEIVPLWRQTPKIAAPPSPPFAVPSRGRQVPLPPSTTVQVPS
jgi:hypothetical protein